jgi:Mg2+-importing ATPase
MSEANYSSLKDFSSKSFEDVCFYLKSDIEKGLSSSEAGNRLLKDGLNTIPYHKKTAWWKELLQHFKSPLIIILLIASIISFTVSETLNASIIVFMIMISVGIDFFQERDARNAAQKLQILVKTKVIVLRDGIETETLHENICIGDILMLNAGKVIPADARIIASNAFYINQSSLTGESFPCEKTSDPIPDATNDLTKFQNIALMGTNVISGSAKAIVVQTAAHTAFGKIAISLSEKDEETDFGRGVREFGYLVMKLTIGLVLFVFLINALLKQNILDSFMFAIAVAVGLTPELLPMIMSLTMSKGSLQMAKKGAIVKRLSAIPNFGSMDVLCTDKTGTLTEDKIKMIKCVDVNGVEDEQVFLFSYLNSFFQTGIKNPLDDAILNHKTPDISIFKKINEIPFDFYRKRMSVVVSEKENPLLICKGAPEEMIKVCNDDKALLEKAMKQYETLSAEGFRVLAIAMKNVSLQNKFTVEDEKNLSLKGFVAFLDPPKEDADDVIRELTTIGVEVKIITGDNHLVTQKICKELGLPIKGIMQGFEMDAMLDDALSKRVVYTTIFSRFSPEQKNRIINALKANHMAVGYMGDGINDAPSLKAADVGISVNSATDIAKESADIILTEKDLLVLKDGILEGRKTFGNTMKYIKMGLSSNFGNMFSVAAATIFLPFLPMLPVQILINNFLYDLSQISIPSDNVDDDYIKLPQRWNMKMIYKFMMIFGITSSIFDLLTFWVLYEFFHISIPQFRTGWFLESLATQILVVFVIRTHMSPFYRSKPSKKLVLSTLSCLAIGWSLPYLPFATKIGFEPLPFHIILYLVVLVAIYLFCAELMKRFVNKRWELAIKK